MPHFIGVRVVEQARDVAHIGAEFFNGHQIAVIVFAENSDPAGDVVGNEAAASIRLGVEVSHREAHSAGAIAREGLT